jgi:hypothetical protein
MPPPLVVLLSSFYYESRADAVDFHRPPLHLQLCQLKWIHALRNVFQGRGVCVCHRRCARGYIHRRRCVRNDSSDFVETKWKLHTTSRPLVPSLVASSCSSLLGISGSPRNGNSSTLTASRPSLAYLVLSHLAPRCCVPIGITSLSRVGLVKFARAAMDPSVPLHSFASLKWTPRASTVWVSS